MARARPHSGLLGDLAEILRVVAIALALSLVLRVLLFQPFTIPSSSMEPGLVTGDYIVVSKFSYGWSRASLPFNPPLFHGRLFGRDPRRGDVVVFRRPSEPTETWIKRVIGLPGDRLQVLRGQVFVNGTLLPQTGLGIARDHDEPLRPVMRLSERQADGRSYVTYDRGRGLPGDDTGVYLVPAGFYFMMGDNRDNSLDSRWSPEIGVGLLPAENIVGKAEMVAMSWKPGASLAKPWTWANLQWDRFFRPVQ